MIVYLQIIFISVVCIQLLYYFFIFSRFAFGKKPKKENHEIFVSIIIAAKNEAENLKQNLDYFIKQDYPNFELILINDNSTDDTLKILNDFKKEHHSYSISVIDINNQTNGSKKYALTKGIAQAKSDFLLFTDADCIPNSKNWIRNMSSHFTKNKAIILGYGAYKKIPNSFLNKIIRFETLLTALQYFSYTQTGLAYMGVGRNIAYNKQLFLKENGFESHKHIRSGDDDLFINQVATKNNIAICYDKDSFTISKPDTSLKKWLKQKCRHITTATHYKPIHQLLLGLFYFTQFLFWTIGFFLLSTFIWQKIAILMAIRIGMQYFIFGFAAKKLNEKDLFIFTPILEVILIYTQLYIFLANSIQKPKTW